MDHSKGIYPLPFSSSPTIRFLNNKSLSQQIRSEMGSSKLGRQKLSPFSCFSAVELLKSGSEEDISRFVAKKITHIVPKAFQIEAKNNGLDYDEIEILSSYIQKNIPHWIDKCRSTGIIKQVLLRKTRNSLPLAKQLTGTGLPCSIFYEIEDVASSRIKVYVQCKGRRKKKNLHFTKKKKVEKSDLAGGKENREYLGVGAWTKFTLSVSYPDGIPVATGAVKMELGEEKIKDLVSRNSVNRMVSILYRSLKCPWIVDLHHTCEYPGKKGFHKMGFWYELCKLGDLQHYKNFLKKKDVIQIEWDLARGVDFLHNSLGVSHRDIAKKNCLLVRRTDIFGQQVIGAKICDFGSSGEKLGYQGEGTLEYLDPACVRLLSSIKEGMVYPEEWAKVNCFTVDIWALGMIFYQLEFAEKALSKDEEKRLLNLDTKSRLLEIQKKMFLLSIGPSLKLRSTRSYLVQRMLDNNPDHRIDAKGVVRYLAPFSKVFGLDK